MRGLLPCPFCGGEVSIALCGDGFDAWWFITRGHGENACKCRLFMESEKFNKDSEMADFVADDLIAAWNRRSDAVPVVRGEWIEHEDEMECPQCGYFWNYCDNDTERFNYCPNCGAKMEDKL